MNHNAMNHDKIRIALSMRLRHENFYFGGKMPNEHALSWKAYLAGIHEWGVITAADLWYLRGFLPDISSEAVEDICSGRTLEMPDWDRIKELEPHSIPQGSPPTFETVGHQTLWVSHGLKMITKPKHIAGRIEVG